ncbi:MGMT family protein [Pseudomonas sp. 5P_3.1_Bac2]|uniref:MGMT family protein n=1 Tax=Pseudomonas sp. 5P_3.1_Bac2 TaxID=2971617 RepID=UPI0021C8CA80|nr:MGMT family protein [Pseudomonas sp. 5P_3.1_Bac2]MCU1717598.1 MGMT family protein [Pseudomonas sp. 5P_3.1_Bac2]
MLNKPHKSLISEPRQPPANSHGDQPQQRRTALYTVLAQIPSGTVTTYGQLAEFAGLGRAARWVGRTLSQLPEDSQLPWHRVIAAGGRLSLPADSLSGIEQRQRLAAEGVLIRNDRIDVQRYGWRPMEHSG